MADTSNFKWTDLIGPGASLGNTFLQAKLGQAVPREQIAENKRQFDLQQRNRAQELQRRNLFQEAAAPAMLGGLGYRNPDQINSFMARLKANGQNIPMPDTVAGKMAANAPDGGGGASTLGKVAGVAGLASTGLGIAKSLGAFGGAAGGPLSGIGGAISGAGMAIPIVGGALLGGSLLANKLIGRGRKAANVLTDPGGMQNSFEQVLRDIDSMGLDPAEAWKQKTDAYHELVNLGTQHAQKGDNERKVVTQMFDTISPYFGEKNPMRA